MCGINYIWRILATGICFIAFSSGGLLLSISIFPLIHVLPMDESRKNRASQFVIHHSFRLFVWLMTSSGVLSVKVVNREKLNNTDDHLIVANHPCLIDVVLIISLIRHTGCIVKESLWKNPFLRGVVSSAGYIKNSEPENLIDSCMKFLGNGCPLIIFPEGTRTAPGKEVKFHRGFANIALRARKNIIPIVIDCSPLSLTKNKKWYDVPRTGRVNITLKIGDAVKISTFTGDDNIPLAARRLTRFLENYYQQETAKNEQLDTRTQRTDYRVPGSRGYNA